MSLAPEDLLDYWFNEVGPDQWFTADAARDAEIRKRFLEAHEQAASGVLAGWESTPTGMLGLMLLLDQFPRHMFRGTARAFATDDMALDLARTAIIKHFDDRIDAAYKLCFYLPFVHSENLGDQRLGLFYVRERTKQNTWVDYAEEAFNTILKFNRFPQRNQALGRPSSNAEEEFLRRGDLCIA